MDAQVMLKSERGNVEESGGNGRKASSPPSAEVAGNTQDMASTKTEQQRIKYNW